MKKASYEHITPSGYFVCDLCVRHCRLAVGEIGFCGVRSAKTDGMYTVAIDHVATVAVDPIEKKPLFHVCPGSPILSFAIAGCNLDCPWCQNYEISQWPRQQQGTLLPGHPLLPQDLVDMAKNAGCHWIAATYTEPTVFFEFAFEVARFAKEAGLRNVWVTNGTLAAEPLRDLLPFLDAANVDLKTCNDPKADHRLGIPSAAVQKNIETMLEAGVIVEITTLLVPGFNDAPWQIRNIASFVGNLHEKGIWHVSRYHPCYRYTLPPTSMHTLQFALEAAAHANVAFVYTGNVSAGIRKEHTLCPRCGSLVIQRAGFHVLENHITPEGTCPACGAHLFGIWK